MSDGGDLGYFQADAMVPQFSKVVFDLKVDEVSAPFETEFGWHIAKLVDRSKAVIPTFEELESEITNYLTMQEIGNLIKAVRKNAAIEIVGAEENTSEVETPDSETAEAELSAAPKQNAPGPDEADQDEADNEQ